MTTTDDDTLHLGLPKGRIHDGVVQLLAEAGIRVKQSARSYRPSISLPHLEVKILKPQDIVGMLHVGTRDLGFAGADWVAEKGADVEEVLDTRLDPVRLVLATPRSFLVDGRLPDSTPERPLICASEYERLARSWLEERGQPYTFVRCYGATEVFPPEDADCIVDNTATGATLAANDLEIVAELMRSSTRLYASRAAWNDPAKRPRIEELVTLLNGVLEARQRVILELNAPAEALERIVAILPSMKQPTVSQLFGDGGYAVKSAVPRLEVPQLIPRLREAGASDILVTSLTQIVP